MNSRKIKKFEIRKMAFKINVAHKGRTFKVESDNEGLVGYSIGDKIDGRIISRFDRL